MNFFSHKIANPTGDAPSFDEWVEKFLEKKASEAKPECDDDPRGQCRGQVINNDNEEGAHSYQEGESVDGKPDQDEGKGKKTEAKTKAAKVKEADCGKEMGECDNAGKVTEDHTDAGNADMGNAAVEQNINNDPNYQKGESTNPGKVDGKNKKESTNPGKVDGKNKKESTNPGKVDGKNKKESSKKSGFKKVASLNSKEKLELFAHMTSQKTKSGTPAWPIQYVEAMVGMKFSNMKEDEKSWFRKFWLTMYPDSYVQEMVSDR